MKFSVIAIVSIMVILAACDTDSFLIGELSDSESESKVMPVTFEDIVKDIADGKDFHEGKTYTVTATVLNVKEAEDLIESREVYLKTGNGKVFFYLYDYFGDGTSYPFWKDKTLTFMMKIQNITKKSSNYVVTAWTVDEE